MDKVGIAVYCAVCRQRKKPRGRSAPMSLRVCDSDCDGWDQPPMPGDLWPGERASEFGYPCGDEATQPC